MECIIIDDLAPEVVAMLQALYSRSPKSVREHLDKARDPDKFMATYYVGYGHKSIGDCGTTSIFIENVSMLAAKAIQDNPLYNGQEASTRYLDMANQKVVNPLGTLEGICIQDKWIDLYVRVLDALITKFKERFPREEGQKKSVWLKAVKARAFDVARGFLPAGCTTYVAWHTNLRQAADHLKLMRHNPCKEIREVAWRIQTELTSRYPSSFSDKIHQESEEYIAKSADTLTYIDNQLVPFMFTHSLYIYGLSQYQDLLATRPPKTELHPRLRHYGSIQFKFPLDFGSFRDIQRQRSCVQDMPLLTTKHGIMPWYMEQLPDDLRAYVRTVCDEQEEAIAKISCTPEEKQYYVAIGYIVPVRITCPLPSAVYIAELRSGTSVHPTVRTIAQQMGQAIKTLVPGIAMHHDMSEGVWDIKRGTQDIVEKDG